jgi:hypothetical protein
VSRPLAKTLIKGYLVLSDMAKEFAAETGEQISDLVAEVKAEREAAVAAEAVAEPEPKPAKVKS